MPLEHHSQPPLASGLQVPKSCPQEWLQHRFWITVHHQNLSGPSWGVHCCKRPRCLVEWGWPPKHPECPWQCSSRWVGWGCRELRGVVYKVNVVSAPPPVERGHNHSAKTPWPATAHLRPAGSQQLPKRCCGTNLGLSPTSKYLLRPLQKGPHSLWGGASSPGSQECPRQCNKTSCSGSRNPGCHQGSVHTQIPPEQCGPILALWGRT